MGDIQFYRGYVNEQAAAAGRFGQRPSAPGAQGAPEKTSHGTAPHETAAGGAAPHSTGDSEFGFDDFLDIINPLQHIPVVSTFYRELTGDEISAPARIFGGTLFGGPSGFISAIANTFFDEIAGEDVGASVLAFFGGGDGDEGPQLAEPADVLNAAPLVTAAGQSPVEQSPVDRFPVGHASLGQPAVNQGAADPTGPTGPTTGEVIPAGLWPVTAPGPKPAAGQSQRSDRGEGVLTGQDALSALFHDLRGGTAPAPSPALPVPAQDPKTLRQVSSAAKTSSGTQNAQAQNAQAQNAQAQNTGINPPQSTATSVEAAPDAAHADAALADQMLMALDKYQAMTRQRGLANQPPNQQQPKPDQP